jgi:hypothetical protein
VNGAVICTDDAEKKSAEAKQLQLTKMFTGETWKADLSNVTWNLPSGWTERKQILSTQLEK